MFTTSACTHTCTHQHCFAFSSLRKPPTIYLMLLTTDIVMQSMVMEIPAWVGGWVCVRVCMCSLLMRWQSLPHHLSILSTRIPTCTLVNVTPGWKVWGAYNSSYPLSDLALACVLGRGWTRKGKLFCPYGLTPKEQQVTHGPCSYILVCVCAS